MTAFIALVSLVLGMWLSHGNTFVFLGLSGAWLLFLFWRFSKNGCWLGILFFVLGAVGGAVKLPYNTNQTQFSGVVIDANDNYFLYRSGLQTYYVYEKNCPRESGDFLAIQGNLGTLKFSHVESQFDFQEYLKNKGVVAQIYPTVVEARFNTPIRTRVIKSRFLSNFEGESRLILAGLLFGDIEDENPASQEMKNLQVSYLLSISGIHLSFMLQVVSFLLTLIIKEKWAKLIAVGSLFPIALFSLGKVAIVRVLLMGMLRWVNEYKLKNKYDSLTLICVLGVICCLISRYIVYSASFLMSFSIPIVFLFSNQLFQTFPKRKRPFLYPLIVFLFVLPMNLMTHFELNFLSVFSQMVLSPLILTLFSLGCFSFYLFPLKMVIDWVTGLFLFCVRFFDSLNATLITGKPGLFFILFYYVFLLVFFVGLESKHYKKVWAAAGLLFLTVGFQSLPVKIAITNTVTFINVGQGDSILIRERNKTVLIDTGGSLYFDVALDCLIPFFKAQKITHIDTLITTHDDFDHNGGAETLIREFEVKNYVTEKEDFPLTIGSLVFENLNNYDEAENESNNRSLVLKLDFMSRTWLFMGDAPIEVEKKILQDNPELDVDILKVGHHGSDTSSSYEFLKTVTPEDAIISVGRNSFGHPTGEVLERLKKVGANIRRTDLEGTICYTESAF